EVLPEALDLAGLGDISCGDDQGLARTLSLDRPAVRARQPAPLAGPGEDLQVARQGIVGGRPVLQDDVAAICVPGPEDAEPGAPDHVVDAVTGCFFHRG